MTTTSAAKRDTAPPEVPETTAPEKEIQEASAVDLLPESSAETLPPATTTTTTTTTTLPPTTPEVPFDADEDFEAEIDNIGYQCFKTCFHVNSLPTEFSLG